MFSRFSKDPEIQRLRKRLAETEAERDIARAEAANWQQRVKDFEKLTHTLAAGLDELRRTTTRKAA